VTIYVKEIYFIFMASEKWKYNLMIMTFDYIVIADK